LGRLLLLRFTHRVLAQPKFTPGRQGKKKAESNVPCIYMHILGHFLLQAEKKAPKANQITCLKSYG
jgi:hypothetical protein